MHSSHAAVSVFDKVNVSPPRDRRFLVLEILFQIPKIAIWYGYVLFQASNLISDGSELLLLVPAAAPVVGSVVLPILGAVPDGMMVLFSGLGPDAQNQVSVGVGALAGSTVMLLTLPWRDPEEPQTSQGEYPMVGSSLPHFAKCLCALKEGLGAEHRARCHRVPQSWVFALVLWMTPCRACAWEPANAGLPGAAIRLP
eukprot:Skav227896  [mRNA]  locus=scaffold1951:174086:176752:- [translate_table: standard]